MKKRFQSALKKSLLAALKILAAGMCLNFSLLDMDWRLIMSAAVFAAVFSLVQSAIKVLEETKPPT